jgi:predicted signal transduction protein with EAL and GGDEF domain
MVIQITIMQAQGFFYENDHYARRRFAPYGNAHIDRDMRYSRHDFDSDRPDIRHRSRSQGSLSNVAAHGLIFGSIISALVAGVLTYRSALLMKDLNSARAELLRLSHTDQLTGLLNRRGYDQAAQRALASAIESNVPAVALMCDIDRFKAINDEFGHEFGDKVLVEISEAIRSFGEHHAMLVGRHGGEEFAALMIGVTVEQAV